VGTFFRYPGPRMPGGILAIALPLRLALGGGSPGDLTVIAAVAGYWPIQEWALHRYLLHLKPLRLPGRRVELEFARRHRAHHGDPGDISLIFLPRYVHLPVPGIPGLFVLALPSLALAMTGIVSLTAAALVYEWTHFVVHTRIRPRGRSAAGLFRHHRLHHFRNERCWFAFTLPGIDAALGTSRPPREVPFSPTCRTLIDESR